MSSYSRDDDTAYINYLLRSGLHKVLTNSNKDLDESAKLELSKIFKEQGLKFLSNYLKAWAKNHPETEISKSTFEFEEIGNFKKTRQVWDSGVTEFQGIGIEIEIKKGEYKETFQSSKRKKSKRKIENTAGFIRTEKGKLSTILGDNWDSDRVYLVNEYEKSGSFKNLRCLLGFESEEAAKTAYKMSSPSKRREKTSLIPAPVIEFKNWIEKSNFQREVINFKEELLKVRLSEVGKLSVRTFVEIVKRGRRKESPTYKEENDPIIETHIPERRNTFLDKILEIIKGRKPAPEGSPRLRADGRQWVKEGGKWRPLKKERSANEKLEEASEKNKQESETSPHTGSVVTKLPFDKIRIIDQYTDKKDFDRSIIDSLKHKIKNEGYDSSFPLIVDKQDSKWTVVAGHHRYSAVEELIKEGELPINFEIPVVTREFASSNERLAAQIAENQRRKVLPTDEAKAYGKMVEDGWSVKKIADKLGLKVGDIEKRLALNNLEPGLFSLVKNKDRSLPLGIAEIIGANCIDESGKPNRTQQIRAYKWYVENRSKYPGRGPSVTLEYIKELKSGELENFDFNSVASDIQREGMKNVGSVEKARTNVKMLDLMLKNIKNSYQKILGDNINTLSPATKRELAASLAAIGDNGVGEASILGNLGIIIRELGIVKEALEGELKTIASNSETPLLFASSNLFQLLYDTENSILIAKNMESERDILAVELVK
ncbi:ParB-like protein [Leptospira phage vB_LbrZ_5399-LE1]|nr:ParB N-terminal domain-containing protein [Leptospira inadai]AGS80763.1 ParB-like protein [Leptospira phage vB_LbrZ_5399-LE1]AGS80842.1 ParB-like protein [Leptospira phage vB_LinZ_10-LE1]